MEENQKITRFTDLKTWQKGHAPVLNIYKITGQLPNNENFGLTSQIQRSAVSITSNIAEGFSRNGSKEKMQFYTMGRGSLTELQNQLLIARDIHYISKEEFAKVADLSVEVHKLLNALIRSTKVR